VNSQDAILAGRYASALFLAARGAKVLDDVHKDLEALDALLKSDAPGVSAVLRPRLPAVAKEEALKRAVGRKLHALTDKFIALLLEKKRLGLLPAAAAFFSKKVDEEKGVVRARIRSAVPLTDLQLKALAVDVEALVSKDRGATVKAELDVVIDPTLLGGIIVRVGDRMWDLSFKGRLVKLKETLLETN
jgi:F-type H+-transporting ATPase subunit delta